MLWKSLLAAASAAVAAAQTLTISFVQSTPLKAVDSFSYLNYNIDTGSIYNGFDWLDPKLIAISRQLGPAILRIGGTANDYSVYIPDSTNPQGGPARTGSVTIISDAILDNIVYFMQETNLTLLWDFNGLTFRNGAGPWNPNGNATQMLDHFQKKFGGQIDYIWSIGNEPEAWPVKVPFAQLAADAQLLSQVLKSYNVGNSVSGSSFEGLEVDAVTQYLNYSGSVEPPFLDVLTVHDYPYARNCNIPSYLDPQPTLNMGKSLAALVAVKNQYASKTLPPIMTLEETSGSYGGGCENITDRFAAGFYWHLALSVIAVNGFDRVHRQDIAGWSFTGGMSHYQLAGPPGWTNGSAAMMPHPDWFTSVLWRQIMGKTVLNTTTSSASPNITSTLMATMWCTAPAQAAAGSAVLAWSNHAGNDVTLAFDSSLNLPLTPRTEYILTSSSSEYYEHLERVASGNLIHASDPVDPPASLQDDAIYNNGMLMYVDPATGYLPGWPAPIAGNPVSSGSTPITLPPYAYGFIVFNGAQVPACM